MEEFYILFINGEPIDYIEYDKGMYKLEKSVFEKCQTPFKIVTTIYRNELINNAQELDEYCEYHGGCWSPICSIEDKRHNITNIMILESSHINEFEKNINLNSTKEFCKANNIKF